MMKSLLALTLLASFSANLTAKEYSLVGFYNVENMFDHLDDPSTNDHEFTPYGKNRWSEKKSLQKISNIAKVIKGMTLENEKSFGPDILGVAEVENSYVLEKLISDQNISNSHYDFVHIDSPDERGIDVAFLYKKTSFKVLSSQNIQVDLSQLTKRPTRDILLVEGLLKGEKVYILVNHWPSRSAGEALTRLYRLKAAQTAKKVIDDINTKDSTAKIILMGDLNDNPIDASLMLGLSAQNTQSALKDNQLFNPFFANYKKGDGSNAYMDVWFNFDQILISNHFLKNAGWKYKKNYVYKKPFLIQQHGRYKNYPLRTFNDLGSIGYSDHFPVYLILEK